MVDEISPRKIQHFFEREVVLHPNKAAIYDGSKVLSYTELNQRANQLARHLLTQGVKPGDFLPIYLEKSSDTFIAILAILKINAVYIPLAVNDPPNKLSGVIKDTGSRHYITSSKLAHPFQGSDIQYVHVDDEAIKNLSHKNIEIHGTESALAYIIYTSGTTSQPKGVMINHDNLIATYQSWKTVYHLSAKDTHLQMANVSFDVFSGDWVRALCSGASLVLCPHEWLSQPEKLYELTVKHKANCAEFVPSTLRKLFQFVKEKSYSLDHFRLLICGSDQWTMKEFMAIKSYCGSHTRLINSYGTSEACIDSTWFEITNNEHGDLPLTSQVPIGQAFPHVHIDIVDEQGQVVKPGEVGEICITGQGVGEGYLNQTTSKTGTKGFVEHAPGQRRYFSGDMAYQLPNGQIAFL